MNGKIICALIFSFVICVSVAGASEGLVKDKEYKEMLEELNRSYEGFFIHENASQRWHRQRMSGADEAKKKRNSYLQQREQARKSFVRKPPKNREPGRLKWEAQQKKIQQKHEKYRAQYVHRRDEIQKVKDTARKIPAKKELGID